MKRTAPCISTSLALALLGGCIGVSQTRHASPGASVAAASAASGAKRCPRGIRVAADGDMDDFEDGNNQLTQLAGRDGYWWTKKDNFGSTVTMTPEDGGAGGSEVAMHVTGVTTGGKGDDNWGAGVGVNFVSQGLLYDASKYVGIGFKAKAGPKATRQVRFKIGDVNTHPDAKVCTNCWNHFGADLTLTGDWRQYDVLFANVQQEAGWGDPRPNSLTPSKLVAIDWTIASGQTYDLWIDNLVLLECKP
jgi:endoglucanase